MEVRIGVLHTAKEMEIDLPENTDRDSFVSDLEAQMAGKGAMVWLTDRRGRRVGVPSALLAYVEIGSPSDERRVGFGAS